LTKLGVAAIGFAAARTLGVEPSAALIAKLSLGRIFALAMETLHKRIELKLFYKRAGTVIECIVLAPGEIKPIKRPVA
jgi:hypothetical protein